ncbi:retrovirus-related pol polyprotein from transposon TNT 1-94 [Tanacetum coccineum]
MCKISVQSKGITSNSCEKNPQVPERKITSGACQILGGKLVCWSAKKQQSVAMSSAEAEYVAAAGLVYQNFLREFWSTVIAFDLFPSTDEPKKCPLKEFLIKFATLNRFSAVTTPSLNKSTPSNSFYPTVSSLGLRLT